VGVLEMDIDRRWGGQGRGSGTFLLEYAEKVPSSSVSDSEVDGRGSK
jgi:hypothetical protein